MELVHLVYDENDFRSIQTLTGIVVVFAVLAYFYTPTPLEWEWMRLQTIIEIIIVKMQIVNRFQLFLCVKIIRRRESVFMTSVSLHSACSLADQCVSGSFIYFYGVSNWSNVESLGAFIGGDCAKGELVEESVGEVRMRSPFTVCIIRWLLLWIRSDFTHIPSFLR